MYDYSQRPITEEYEKGWDKVFTPLSIEVMQENAKKMLGKNCHYSRGGKYVCVCGHNICKKDIKR